MPKKSPNNPNIPKLSKINPINAYFNNINSIPRIKQIVPLNFVGRLKNAIVRCGPIINVIPIINNTLPSANNAESKNVIIPNTKKKIPPAVKLTPNSNIKKEKERIIVSKANFSKKQIQLFWQTNLKHTLSFR